jgi:hypothetical protein
MALSKQVKDSVEEANSSLRNALAFAARGEHPVIIQSLSEILLRLEQLAQIDELMGKLGVPHGCSPF